MLGFGLVIIGGIIGCAKDTTLIIKNDVVVTNTVSFSKDLVPIFIQNCALSGCHASGGQVPDLTAAKAYNSIINASLVNTNNPTSSIIYERLTGVLTPAMPFGKTSNPSNINNLVLAWIKQGAKNN